MAKDNSTPAAVLLWVTELQYAQKQFPFGIEGFKSKFAMDTNRSDKERSGYLAKQRNATALALNQWSMGT